ncbi:hypothetical protein MTR10_10845 [Staphylococcus agnetis]|uniref:hypothetical protein n=1 Tax=Staphylococcus agnetis TaxID=985762 RepID=UPI00208F8362|nr:hypothetical protein [Staphylococcus agnetis]MCO4360942.1 hypothetical protein [Staphylococcus agnetis]MCO4372563.1 hypothetical protein [Staphylococcus agnetis]
MVKIKVKKEFTLPELIQWGWKNGEEQRIFRASNDGLVCFNDDSWVTIETAVEPDETFTFEVEEEITEETEIPVLIKMFEVSKIPRTRTSINSSIKEELEIVEKFGFNDPKAFYMLNSDSTATLLWKDGEMVE